MSTPAYPTDNDLFTITTTLALSVSIIPIYAGEQPLSKDIDDNLAPETTNRVEDLEGDEETKKLLEEIESRNSE